MKEERKKEERKKGRRKKEERTKKERKKEERGKKESPVLIWVNKPLNEVLLQLFSNSIILIPTLYQNVLNKKQNP